MFVYALIVLLCRGLSSQTRDSYLGPSRFIARAKRLQPKAIPFVSVYSDFRVEVGFESATPWWRVFLGNLRVFARVFDTMISGMSHAIYVILHVLSDN